MWNGLIDRYCCTCQASVLDLTAIHCPILAGNVCITPGKFPNDYGVVVLQIDH